MKHDVFTIRLSPEERRRIITLRGELERQGGERVSLADVVRLGLECLEAQQKKNPAATRG
jgi:hypothetical protein